ncbi:hypothetical protein GGER_17650 [Serratia rubidaea]
MLITHRTNLLSMTNKLLLLTNGQVNAFGGTQQVIQAISQAQKSPVQQNVQAVNGELEQENTAKTQTH